MKRTVFLGTPAFAVPSLEAVDRLCDRGALQLVAVVTQPDPRTIGVPVFQPAGLRGTALETVLALRPELLVWAAYGNRIPATLIQAAAGHAINVHASLLPRWRGAAPIAHAILAGDRETGVTLMLGTAELDAGPILAQRRTAIASGETRGQLETRLAAVGGALLADELPRYLGAWPLGTPQDPAQVTHGPKLDPRARLLADGGGADTDRARVHAGSRRVHHVPRSARRGAARVGERRSRGRARHARDPRGRAARRRGRGLASPRRGQAGRKARDERRGVGAGAARPVRRRAGPVLGAGRAEEIGERRGREVVTVGEDRRYALPDRRRGTAGADDLDGHDRQVGPVQRDRPGERLAVRLLREREPARRREAPCVGMHAERGHEKPERHDESDEVTGHPLPDRSATVIPRRGPRHQRIRNDSAESR
ncbi:MAG: hypothetical protein E6I20_02510 [Chloroflexi bacterium]|nr:MAG: hypothetical protein E6I20_02510 [Chloroflexota bacterium]